MVMMMVIIPTISRDHHDRRVVITAIEAVVVMVMVMMIELSDLNIFAGFWRGRLIEGLQPGAGVRDRLQQVGV